MKRTTMIRVVRRGLVTVGIVLTLVLAGGAPSDFTYNLPQPWTQVGQ